MYLESFIGDRIETFVRHPVFAGSDFTVVGVYMDETCSAPLAKYSDLRRAADSANLVNRIARVQGPVESN